MDINVVHNESIKNALNEAKQLIDLKMVDPALSSIRKTLETVLIYYSKLAGLSTPQDNAEVGISFMIDALKEREIIDNQLASKLHRIRILGNKGAHNTTEPTYIEDAQEAYELLTEVIIRMDEISELSKESIIIQGSNEPMKNPDYYSPNRRYYGKWNQCYSREELLQIPEYVNLEQRANTGDISAMLDLAVGFLSKKINWGYQGLICMPPYEYKEFYFSNKKAFDYRYYYWIIRAVDATRQYYVQNPNNLFNGKIPLKYISNALIECIKFAFFNYERWFFYVSYVDNGQPVYTDQYELASKMLGTLNVSLFDVLYYKILVTLLEKYGSDIIAHVHKENTIIRVKYLCYVFSYLISIKENDYSLWEQIKKQELLISPKYEMNQKISKDILQEYTFDYLCNYYYSYLLEITETNRIINITDKNISKHKKFSILYIVVFIIMIVAMFVMYKTKAFGFVIEMLFYIFIAWIFVKRKKGEKLSTETIVCSIIERK